MIEKKEKGFRKFDKARSLEFSSVLFSVMVIGVVVFAIGTWISSFNTMYNKNIAYDLNKLNKLEDMNSYSQQYVQGLTVKDSVSGEDFRGVVMKGAFGILNTIFLPFDLIIGRKGLVATISDKFGIPEYIEYAFFTMLLMAIIFSLIRIFFKTGHRI